MTNVVLLSSWLSHIALVESGGDHLAVGDGGRAVGAWQMHSVAWADADLAIVKAGGRALPPSWRTNAEASHLHAAVYLVALCKKFEAETHREPRSDDVYAMWNLGFTGYRRTGFRIDRAPQVTQQGARRMRESR